MVEYIVVISQGAAETGGENLQVVRLAMTNRDNIGLSRI